jgi:hypothetical protein
MRKGVINTSSGCSSSSSSSSSRRVLQLLWLSQLCSTVMHGLRRQPAETHMRWVWVADPGVWGVSLGCGQPGDLSMG